jgi:hypothetical protein
MEKAGIKKQLGEGVKEQVEQLNARVVMEYVGERGFQEMFVAMEKNFVKKNFQSIHMG